LLLYNADFHIEISFTWFTVVSSTYLTNEQYMIVLIAGPLFEFLLITICYMFYQFDKCKIFCKDVIILDICNIIFYLIYSFIVQCGDYYVIYTLL